MIRKKMKKKVLTLMLVLAVGTMLSACGESKESNNKGEENTETVEKEKEPTDLTGTWKSEDNDGSYQEAVISADYIEINWVSDGGNTKSLYWAGSYAAPTEYVEEYSWTSTNDQEKTSSALLASSDETKEFSYEEGKISYEASALGTTTTMYLEKE